MSEVKPTAPADTTHPPEIASEPEAVEDLGPLDSRLSPQPLHSAPAAIHPAEDHGFGSALGSRDFRYLWSAQVTSQLADKFLMYTLLLYVYSLAHLAVVPSLLMVAYTLPSVLLSAPAGVYADRHDKRQLMFLCNVLRGVLILIVPISAHIPALSGQVYVPIAVTLLFSSVGQVFAPAEAASIPSLVAREQITSATSLFITTVIITLVVGVPAATLVSAFMGHEVPFYVATGLFMVAAYSIFKIETNLRAEQTPGAPAPHVIRELREGMAILGGSPALRLALIELTLSLVIVFTLFALGPAYMTTVLQISPDDTALVLIPATLGMITAAAVLSQRAHQLSRARLLVVALFTAGATLLIIGVAPSWLRAIHFPIALIPLTVIVAYVFGCALGSLLIPAFTVLQERTTEETRGRIFGGIFTVINAAVAVPLILAGGLADIFRVDRVFAVAGLLLVLVAGAARLWFWDRLAVLEDVDRA